MSKDRRSGTGRFRPIADALPELLKARGLDDDVARAWVIEAWPAIVGTQIAGVTQPRLVTEDGTLVVGVQTHGWMSELSLLERTLVTKINAAAAGAAAQAPVRRIRWELLR